MAIDLGAEGAVVQALGRHLEIQGAIGILGHQLHGTQLGAIRGDLPDAAPKIHYCAIDPVWQANFGAIGYPFDGDSHLLGAILMDIAGAAAGGLGVLGLQPQVQGDHIPLGAARLVLNVGDDGIPHRVDGDGEAVAGLERQSQPLVQGEGAQGELHAAAEVCRRDQGQLGEICAHRHLPDAAAIVDRRGRQGEAVRHALDLQRHYLLGAIIVDQGRAQPAEVDAAILVAVHILHRELGRIVDRQHLEARIAAPAAAIRPRGGGVQNVHLDTQGDLTTEVLLGHEHQILERRRVVHPEGGDRLAIAIEEMAILGIDGHGDLLHRLQAAIGHRGADVRQLDREIEVDLGVFQVVRLAVAVHILHLQVQLGLTIGAALDVHLGGDGEGDVLLHLLDITAHRVGIDQTHVEAQAVTGIVFRQGQGQLVQIAEAIWQLDQIFVVDEVEGEPLYVDAGRQACDDDAELVIPDVRRAQGHHALELAAEVDTVIFHPCDGGAVVKIDIGGHLARVGRVFELGAGGELPISRRAHIPFVVVAKIDHPGADLEGDCALVVIRRAQGEAPEGAVRHCPVALAVVDPPHHHEAGRQIADHQIVDGLDAAGIQILEHEDTIERNIVPVRALQRAANLYQIAIGFYHGLDIHMQLTIDLFADYNIGVHILLSHGDMALDSGVPVAVLRTLHQQLTAAEQALQIRITQLHLAAVHGELGLNPTCADPDLITWLYAGETEVSHLFGAVGEVRLPVEDGELILQTLAGLGIVTGVDHRLHLDGERHIEALVIPVVLGHHHVADEVDVGGAVGGRLDLQVAQTRDVDLIGRLALGVEPGEGQGQLLAVAIEHLGSFRQAFQHQVEGFGTIARRLSRRQFEVQRRLAIFPYGGDIALAILAPTGAVQIEVRLIHHPHQIHMQALAAGHLLVDHCVSLTIGIGQGGGIFYHPLDAEIEVDVAVLGRLQLELADTGIGHLVITVRIQGDRHAAEPEGGTGGQAADAHEHLLGAISSIPQMGERYLAAQIQQVVFLALDVAHRQLGVIRLRVDVDHQFDGIAEGRLLAGDYGGFLRADRGHNELDVTAVVLAGHHGDLVDLPR
ncbi:hypothetical protein D3C76_518560 [compost metagenome]